MTEKLKFKDDEGLEHEDLLKSDIYLQNFDLEIKNSNYSVYSLSGDWGVGKTSFIKMWENKLKTENEKFVHIDAFRMDYETEPFLMLISAFKQFMKENKTDAKKQKDFFQHATATRFLGLSEKLPKKQQNICLKSYRNQ